MSDTNVKVSEATTYMAFVGSRCVEYSWYTNVTMSPDDWTLDDSAYVGWSLAWTDVDSSKRHTVTHEDIMRAAKNIAAGDTQVSDDTATECRTLLSDPEGIDFDADTADQVLQYLAHGRIVYG